MIRLISSRSLTKSSVFLNLASIINIFLYIFADTLFHWWTLRASVSSIWTHHFSNTFHLTKVKVRNFTLKEHDKFSLQSAFRQRFLSAFEI